MGMGWGGTKLADLKTGHWEHKEEDQTPVCSGTNLVSGRTRTQADAEPGLKARTRGGLVGPVQGRKKSSR